MNQNVILNKEKKTRLLILYFEHVSDMEVDDTFKSLYYHFKISLILVDVFV